MYNKVEICGVNTAKLKVLSNEEKLSLLKRAKKGDKYAREELISGNLRLVLSVIQSFQNRGENPDDLFQVGCIGLIKAVDNFDMSLDVKFSTYAVPMILGEVRRYLRDNNMVRVSRSLRDLAYKALQAKEKLSVSLSREPTIDEIAKEIGEKPQSITNALDAIVDPISLYDPVYSDSGDSIFVLDQISDTACNDDVWLNNIAMSEAIKKLNERERKILLLRFYNGKTQTEVSEEIGISQAQVSRLEKHALEKIKKQM
ncbi:MAG: RNA polymerase sporulation sigma factor SigG [Firmicutes bacterium HGW-Firmicutes-21]|nr:MAG: RNA polymerase sporulation sigma factor SigG [Firmicutes bacterium HGW-Firmicutes-21]